MTTLTATKNDLLYQNALDIPAQSHAEAGKLAATEAERLLALLESLAGDDWRQATDCTEWNVRDIVAHLAGSVAGQSSWAEFKRQNVGNPYMKEADLKVDAINRRQLEDRAGATNEELVAEFRENAPKAVRTRERLPWLVRKLHVPFGPPLGFTSIDYLTDTIFTRDQWMHRLDIARATGQEMVVTPEHDGRIVALVLRDLARKLKGQLQGRTVNLLLTGAAGGSFRFGTKGDADAAIALDVFTFSRLASGRLTAASALAEVTIEGDRATATWFLNEADVPY